MSVSVCVCLVLLTALSLCEGVVVEREAPRRTINKFPSLSQDLLGRLPSRAMALSPEGRLPSAAAAGARSKRDGDDGDCGMHSPLTYEAYEMQERKETIQAIWVGKDEILILASSKTEEGETTVYRGSYRPSVLSFRFTSSDSAISSPVYPDSLITSPADGRATVVVVSLNRRFLFVSRTAGENWDRYSTPTEDFDPSQDLYLSGRDPRHMIIRSNGGKMYVSGNAGRQWQFVARQVLLVEIVTVNASMEYVYYSTKTEVSEHSPLYRMNIADRTTKVIDHTAFRFRVDSKYLFVSRKNITGNRAADDKSRRLYVATDYAQEKVTFTEVQLPSLQDEQFYVVMATHETGAFIHVYNGSDKGYGQLYVSDSSGSTFSLSLQKHLFQVHNSLFGHFTVHDFYEVSSARGTYITTMYDSPGEHHVTMITFDNGGVWQRVPAPEGACSPGDVCSLHLYLKSSRLASHLYNLSSASGPLSISSAPNIIVAHGNVGSYSAVDRAQSIFVSGDGGHTWKKAAMPDGTYVYGIADYGNVIAVAPDTSNVEYMWVSHDRGGCFVRKVIDTLSVFQLSRGLLIDPSAASLYGFVLGVEGTGAKDPWRVITVYFHSLLNRQCGREDYSSVASTSCVMGYRPVYNLTKPSAVCYNDASYSYKPVSTIACLCSHTDYECDYGFKRANRTACVKVSNEALSLVCPPGTDSYQISDSGFRLIPGDNCTATNGTTTLLSKKTHKCKGHESSSGFDANAVKSNMGVKVFGGIVIILAILTAAGLLTYCALRCNKGGKSHDRVYYQRLPLSEAGSKFSANDSSSDEDLITAT